MQEVWYDIIYLAACNVNQTVPSEQFQQAFSRKMTQKTAENAPTYLKILYQLSCMHQMEALVGTALQKAQIPLLAAWKERMFKAVRKTIMFDAERKKLLAFMEQNGILYMPLKGVILKNFYPAVGMRQMSDNDILFDRSFQNQLEMYMKTHGYMVKTIGNHSVCNKEPIYNFELHTSLYGSNHRKAYAYYQNVKERLIPDAAGSYGYHFTDEDFYIYILSHAYKHYMGTGTGLRSLLDFYVYLRQKEAVLDFDYIQKECKKLEMADFERANRQLCKKVFADGAYQQDAWEQKLSAEEQEMLAYYCTSGVHGNLTVYVQNTVREKGKVGSLIAKIFLPANDMENQFPVLRKVPVLLPFCWVIRLGKVVFVKKRRARAVQYWRTFWNILKNE